MAGTDSAQTSQSSYVMSGRLQVVTDDSEEMESHRGT